MQAHFILDAEELDYSFVDKLKVLFKDKRIELVISESDDTQYLLKNPANQQHLLSAIENSKNKENLVEVDSELFQ